MQLACVGEVLKEQRRIGGGEGAGGVGVDPVVFLVAELIGKFGIGKQAFAQLVVLGTGESKYEQFFARIAAQHPHKARYLRAFSEPMAHLIEAGSDMFLMPSRYEPCGLNQLYSLRYGTVPVVRMTGGLADTVHEFDPITREGNGFVAKHGAEFMKAAATRSLRPRSMPAV